MKPAADQQPKSAIVPLYRSERRFLSDRSRLKGWVKARQIGGSFTCALDLALDAVQNAEDWNTMSRSQRQAEKFLLKVARHLRAINRYTIDVLGGQHILDESRIGSQKIVLNNGATIEAMPCDADTTVGDTTHSDVTIRHSRRSMDATAWSSIQTAHSSAKGLELSNPLELLYSPSRPCGSSCSATRCWRSELRVPSRTTHSQ